MSILASVEHAQVLPGRFRLPVRMTILALAPGHVALVSPIPLTPEVEALVARHGEVDFLIAPSLFHHLYLGAAAARYPKARVLAPAGLRKKRPELRIDATLEEGLPAALAAHVDVVKVAGAPIADEHVFFHGATRTLVVTDLVFHVERPRGLVTGLILRLVGCHGRLGHSRSWSLFIKDKAAAAASLQAILAWPFEHLVVAHGTPVEGDAHARLSQALAPRISKHLKMLPA
ncbi:MAG: DUF4336 domain-containing protein [bacterium]